MREFWIFAILALVTPLHSHAQVVDSLSSPDPEVILEILEYKDSIAFDSILIPDPEWDTTYFNPGDPETNLIIAAERGQQNVVEMLVTRGVSVNTATYEGVTPLMYASQAGDTSMLNYLIGQGADLDTRPDNGISALIGAARADQPEVVRILAKEGARVDQKDYTDLTALMHASAYNYPDVVAILTEEGADIESGDWFETTPLMIATYYNCYESAIELIRLGANINAQDTFGFTPLMIASQHGDYDMGWMLLDQGADPFLQNRGGQHAISLAVINTEPDMVELLIENGADVNQHISWSANALSMAEEMDRDSMKLYLEDLGARKNRAPEISEIRFGASLDFNSDDFMVGFEGGVSESKYNSFATTGFMFRPSAVRVLRTENDALAFQLWEKRYIWPLTIGKNFNLYKYSSKSYGIRAQLTGALTWGSYRGSNLHPRVRYLLIPSAGLFWRDTYYGITFDYGYVPLRVKAISSHRFRLGLQFFIDIRKRNRFTRKHIEWF